MKKLFSLLMVLSVAVISHAQFTSAQLQATGLTCAMCSNAINKSLQALPAVQSVKSDIKNSAFNIVFRAPQDAGAADVIRKAVEDAGFSVGSLAMTGTFDKLKVTNDAHVTVQNQVLHFLDVPDQVLDGTKTIRIVDKEFLTSRQFKKIRAATKMECVDKGKSAACCTQAGVESGHRIFHVTI